MESKSYKNKVCLSFLVASFAMLLLGFSIGRFTSRYEICNNNKLENEKFYFESFDALELFILNSIQKDLNLSNKQLKDITPGIETMLRECFAIKREKKILVKQSLIKCRKVMMHFLTKGQQKKLIEMARNSHGEFIDKMGVEKGGK